MAGCWFTAGFCYYSMSFNVKYLPGNIFSNMLFNSTADVIGFILSGILFHFLWAKKTYVVAYCFSALSGVFFIMAFGNPTVVPYALFASKLGIAAALNNNYIANISLFPVEIRTTTFGVCNVFGRIGGILGPLAAELS